MMVDVTGGSGADGEEIGVSHAGLDDTVCDNDSLGRQHLLESLHAFLVASNTGCPLNVSIEGDWGSGKSTFLQQLRERLKPHGEVVSFNPWRHESHESLWAALALKVERKLRRRFSWRQRLCFDIQLAYSRLQREREEKSELNLVLLLWSLIQGVVTFFQGSTLKIEFGKSVRARPDYRRRIEFIESFHEDFRDFLYCYLSWEGADSQSDSQRQESSDNALRRFLNCLRPQALFTTKPKRRLYLMIDDLDRCEAPHAAQLMQGINLMLGDDLPVIYLLAMDRRMIAAGLALRHEKLQPYLASLYSEDEAQERSKGEQEAKQPEAAAVPGHELALAHGYEFMEKFIQLPIALPRAGVDDVRRYLQDLGSPAAKQETAVLAGENPADDKLGKTDGERSPSSGTYETNPSQQTNEGAKPTKGASGEPQTETDKPQHKEKKPPPPSQAQVYLGGKETLICDILSELAFALDNNPRRIKQCLNMLRFRAVLAHTTGLLQLGQGDDNDEGITLPQLAKLVVLQQRWPLLFAHLQMQPSLCQQVGALSDSNRATPMATALAKAPRRQLLQQLLQYAPQGASTQERARWRLDQCPWPKIFSALPPQISYAELAARSRPEKNAVAAETEDFASPQVDASPPDMVSLANGKQGEDECGAWWDIAIEGVTQRFRWIPPGEFLMGSPEDEPEQDDDEGPQHRVILTQGYWLADTACTQELWRAVMGDNPSRFKDDEQNPVEQVSWDDCQRLLSQLNGTGGVEGWRFALPTEAQWEYACRAGTMTPFWWGSELTPEEANYDGNYPYAGGEKGEYRGKAVEVKRFKRNLWGLWQMHGNVWEWCADDPRTYSEEVATNPGEQPEGRGRALRGGSWIDLGGRVRAASRGWNPPGLRNGLIGLRLALRSSSQGGPGRPDS